MQTSMSINCPRFHYVNDKQLAILCVKPLTLKLDRRRPCVFLQLNSTRTHYYSGLILQLKLAAVVTTLYTDTLHNHHPVNPNEAQENQTIPLSPVLFLLLVILSQPTSVYFLCSQACNFTDAARLGPRGRPVSRSMLQPFTDLP